MNTTDDGPTFDVEIFKKRLIEAREALTESIDMMTTWQEEYNRLYRATHKKRIKFLCHRWNQNHRRRKHSFKVSELQIAARRDVST